MSEIAITLAGIRVENSMALTIFLSAFAHTFTLPFIKDERIDAILVAPAFACVRTLNKVRWALFRTLTLALFRIPDLRVRAHFLRAGHARTFLFIKNGASKTAIWI